MTKITTDQQHEPVEFLHVGGIYWFYLYLHEAVVDDGYQYDFYDFCSSDTDISPDDVKANPESYIPEESTEDKVKKLQTQINAISTATDTSIEFLEDCLMEMAEIVYGDV